MVLNDAQQKDFDETFKKYIDHHFRGSAEEAAALRSVAISWYLEGIQFAAQDIIKDAEKFREEIRNKYKSFWY